MRSIVILLAAAAGPIAAHAAQGPLVVESRILTEKKAAAADGTTRVALVSAEKVVPGDKVVFVLSYRNTGSQPLANIVFDNPVPAQIAYRGPASATQAPEVSVGGKAFGPLGTLRVATADGGERAATADDVTHVRWRLAAPLPAGAQGQFAFQAVLK